MTNETNTPEQVEVLSVPFTGTGEVTVNKEKITLALPTLDDIRTALTDSAHAETVHGFVLAALGGFQRNVAKAGRAQPDSFEGILQSREEARAAKGGTGAGLQIARECANAFKAHLLTVLGLPEVKAAKITRLFASVTTLELAAVPLRTRIQSVAADWAATLSDEDALKYASHIEKVEMCGIDDADLLADF